MTSKQAVLVVVGAIVLGLVAGFVYVSEPDRILSAHPRLSNRRSTETASVRRMSVLFHRD